MAADDPNQQIAIFGSAGGSKVLSWQDLFAISRRAFRGLTDGIGTGLRLADRDRSRLRPRSHHSKRWVGFLLADGRAKGVVRRGRSESVLESVNPGLHRFSGNAPGDRCAAFAFCKPTMSASFPIAPRRHYFHLRPSCSRQAP